MLSRVTAKNVGDVFLEHTVIRVAKVNQVSCYQLDWTYITIYVCLELKTARNAKIRTEFGW